MGPPVADDLMIASSDALRGEARHQLSPEESAATAAKLQGYARLCSSSRGPPGIVFDFKEALRGELDRLLVQPCERTQYSKIDAKCLGWH